MSFLVGWQAHSFVIQHPGSCSLVAKNDLLSNNEHDKNFRAAGKKSINRSVTNVAPFNYFIGTYNMKAVVLEFMDIQLRFKAMCNVFICPFNYGTISRS